MKKIVFVTLMMADDMQKKHYPMEDSSLQEYAGEVYYAINAILAHSLKSDDDVKVVLLDTKGGDNAGEKNAQLFISELNELNKCGANITYKIIPNNFIDSKSKQTELYKQLIKTFESEAELYADITFGPKSLPLLIFAAMQFGEKFFDCTIGNVIYLKTEFKNNKIDEASQIICNYTPLYMLNSFTNAIECVSGEKAIAAVEALLGK